MLLGSSGAGKTSLMRSVTTGKASCTGGGDVSTVGIEMESWKPMGEDPPLVVSFWDFAGQEEYYAYHQLFITPGTLCLLVVDLTLTIKGNDQLMQWVDTLLAHVPGCHAVLVGTHGDMLAPEAVKERMRYLEDSIKRHVDCRKGEAERAQKRDVARAKYGFEAEHAGSAGGTVPSLYLHGCFAVSSRSYNGVEDLAAHICKLALPGPEEPKVFSHVGGLLTLPYIKLLDIMDRQRHEGIVCMKDQELQNLLVDSLEQELDNPRATMEAAIGTSLRMGTVLETCGYVHLVPGWMMALVKPLADHKLKARVVGAWKSEWEKELEALVHDGAMRTGGEHVELDEVLQHQNDFLARGLVTLPYLHCLWQLWWKFFDKDGSTPFIKEFERLSTEVQFFKSMQQTMEENGVIIPVERQGGKAKVKDGDGTCALFVAPPRLENNTGWKVIRHFLTKCHSSTLRSTCKMHSLPLPPGVLPFFIAQCLLLEGTNGIRRVVFMACASCSAHFQINYIDVLVTVGRWEISLYISGAVRAECRQVADKLCEALKSMLRTRFKGLQFTDPAKDVGRVKHSLAMELGLRGPEEDCYDVFLSHAGPEKRGIVHSLHTSLWDRGVLAFMDRENLEAGGDAVEYMKAAAKKAKIGLVMLSPSFMSRKWCLLELEIFMSRLDKQEGTQPIILLPLFYKLTPDECRDPDSLRRYPEVSKQWKEWEGNQEMSESLQRWKELLPRLAKLTGIEFTSMMYESDYLNRVVEELVSELQAPTDSTDKVEAVCTEWVRKRNKGDWEKDLEQLASLEVLRLSQNKVSDERAVLMSLFEDTNGQQWGNNDGWGTARPLSAWHGVTVIGGHILGLSLPVNRLEGSIPAKLGQLTNLRWLDLSGNELSGSIPSELGQLSSLEELDLSWNQLSGCIPTELGELKQLTFFSISSNKLTGAIPNELSKLHHLRTLDLEHNQFTGIVPSELVELIQLRLHEREALVKLYFATKGDKWKNSDGWATYEPIEKWYGVTVEDGRVIAVQLKSNNLQGSIPDAISQMKKLRLLQLNDNLLFGDISNHALWSLTSLESLWLGGNLELKGPAKDSTAMLALSKLQHPPPDYVSWGWSKMETWWEAVQRSGATVSNQLKVVLTGEAYAGKTSLYNHVRNHEEGLKETPLEPHSKRTKIAVKQPGVIRRNEIDMNIWDFGGQSEYFGYHQLFLSPNTLNVLVVNLERFNEEDDHRSTVDDWFDALAARAFFTPLVLVVGSKADKLSGGEDKVLEVLDKLRKRVNDVAVRERRVHFEIADTLAFSAKSEKCWRIDESSKLCLGEVKLAEELERIALGYGCKSADASKEQLLPSVGSLIPRGVQAAIHMLGALCEWESDLLQAAVQGYEKESPLELIGLTIELEKEEKQEAAQDVGNEVNFPSTPVQPAAGTEGGSFPSAPVQPAVFTKGGSGSHDEQKGEEKNKTGKKTTYDAKSVEAAVQRVKPLDDQVVDPKEPKEATAPEDKPLRSWIRLEDAKKKWSKVLTDAQYAGQLKGANKGDLIEAAELLVKQGLMLLTEAGSETVLHLDPSWLTRLLQPIGDHQLNSFDTLKELSLCNPLGPAKTIPELSEKVGELCCRGVLHRDLLNVLWSPEFLNRDAQKELKVQSDDVETLFKTLEESGTLLPLQESQSWLVPFRLPDFVIEEDLPVDIREMEKGLSGEFKFTWSDSRPMCFLPAGFIALFTSWYLRSGSFSEVSEESPAFVCWADGVCFTFSNNVGTPLANAVIFVQPDAQSPTVELRIMCKDEEKTAAVKKRLEESLKNELDGMLRNYFPGVSEVQTVDTDARKSARKSFWNSVDPSLETLDKLIDEEKLKNLKKIMTKYSRKQPTLVMVTEQRGAPAELQKDYWKRFLRFLQRRRGAPAELQKDDRKRFLHFLQRRAWQHYKGLGPGGLLRKQVRLVLFNPISQKCTIETCIVDEAFTRKYCCKIRNTFVLLQLFARCFYTSEPLLACQSPSWGALARRGGQVVETMLTVPNDEPLEERGKQRYALHDATKNVEACMQLLPLPQEGWNPNLVEDASLNEDVIQNEPVSNELQETQKSTTEHVIRCSGLCSFELFKDLPEFPELEQGTLPSSIPNVAAATKVLRVALYFQKLEHPTCHLRKFSAFREDKQGILSGVTLVASKIAYMLQLDAAHVPLLYGTIYFIIWFAPLPLVAGSQLETVPSLLWLLIASVLSAGSVLGQRYGARVAEVVNYVAVLLAVPVFLQCLQYSTYSVPVLEFCAAWLGYFILLAFVFRGLHGWIAASFHEQALTQLDEREKQVVIPDAQSCASAVLNLAGLMTVQAVSTEDLGLSRRWLWSLYTEAQWSLSGRAMNLSSNVPRAVSHSRVVQHFQALARRSLSEIQQQACAVVCGYLSGRCSHCGDARYKAIASKLQPEGGVSCGVAGSEFLHPRGGDSHAEGCMKDDEAWRAFQSTTAFAGKDSLKNNWQCGRRARLLDQGKSYLLLEHDPNYRPICGDRSPVSGQDINFDLCLDAENENRLRMPWLAIAVATTCLGCDIAHLFKFHGSEEPGADEQGITGYTALTLLLQRACTDYYSALAEPQEGHIVPERGLVCFGSFREKIINATPASCFAGEKANEPIFMCVTAEDGCRVQISNANNDALNFLPNNKDGKRAALQTSADLASKVSVNVFLHDGDYGAPKLNHDFWLECLVQYVLFFAIGGANVLISLQCPQGMGDISVCVLCVTCSLLVKELIAKKATWCIVCKLIIRYRLYQLMHAKDMPTWEHFVSRTQLQNVQMACNLLTPIVAAINCTSTIAGLLKQCNLGGGATAKGSADACSQLCPWFLRVGVTTLVAFLLVLAADFAGSMVCPVPWAENDKHAIVPYSGMADTEYWEHRSVAKEYKRGARPIGMRGLFRASNVERKGESKLVHESLFLDCGERCGIISVPGIEDPPTSKHAFVVLESVAPP
ncbi:unnamed protein product [Chrysoparadoxa australica]